MDIGALLIGIALSLLTIPFVVGPLLQGATRTIGNPEPPESDLKTRKGQILASLTELEFDHQLEKIVDEDYLGVREQLMAEAGLIYQQKEALTDDVIEQLISNHKKSKNGDRICNRCSLPLAAVDRFCSGCGEAHIPEACAHCGTSAAPADLFCTICGRPTQQSTIQSSQSLEQK